MTVFNQPEIKFLSEQSVLLDWGPVIDLELNRRIHQFARWIVKNPFEGFKEIQPAYSSIAVFFDPAHKRFYLNNQSPFESVKVILIENLQKIIETETGLANRKIEIPVLYNGPDLKDLSTQKNMPVSELIGIHTAKVYDVFMLGFLPGFAYLGLLDNRIAAPRLATPRTRVAAGSVGIAGNQTGVYPVESPGGWQLIGITPLKMFDPLRTEPALLHAGDQVVFRSVSEKEFLEWNQAL